MVCLLVGSERYRWAAGRGVKTRWLFAADPLVDEGGAGQSGVFRRSCGSRGNRIHEVSGPIVYVSHFRIKPGYADAWWKMVSEVIPVLKIAKPRTAFQHFYVDEEGTSVSIVHVFPDSEAVDLHMEGATSRSQSAMEYLEPLGFELYGEPTESFLAAMGEATDLLQVKPTHKAGFDQF